jgi:hypothetical protein
VVSRMPEMDDDAGEKIIVELYCLKPEADPVAELVSAVANSVRWKDRLDVRVQKFDGNPAVPAPYGHFRDDTVVVCGTHVIRSVDYAALTRALEDCEQQGPS